MVGFGVTGGDNIGEGTGSKIGNEISSSGLRLGAGRTISWEAGMGSTSPG
jgi:hypothetical protein